MNKRIELYVNSTKEKAKLFSKEIEKELILDGYQIVRDNPDIIIGFGGDGTLLNLLRERNYDTKAKYIGINCGTLGFMQDFEVDNPIDFVKNIPNYIEQKVLLISLEVVNGKEKQVFNALNDFNVQNANNKSFRAKLIIDNEELEDYVGTGMLFSTPTGSTAHNFSSVGCIVHHGIDVIQITPREAIVSKKIHCLPKAICIPKEIPIILLPSNEEKVEIFSDGETVYKGAYEKINIFYSNLSLTKLTDKKSSFVKKIREKFI